MKELFIVANWKANMTSSEATKWLQRCQISNVIRRPADQISNKDIVICPPFTLLSMMRTQIEERKLPIKLGSQDVSPFPKGAYTGEIAADQLKEFVSYVIIGHNERRKYFREDDQMLANKVDMALASGIVPIYCVQDEHTIVPKGVSIVVYEPVFAIGTGEPDTPDNANSVATGIKEKAGVQTVLYGGSVTPDNVHSFMIMEHIDGVLVGSASLDPVSFGRIYTRS